MVIRLSELNAEALLDATVNVAANVVVDTPAADVKVAE